MRRIFTFTTLLIFTAFIAFSQESKSSAKKEVTTEWDGYKKYRFGGYAEMLYQHMNYGPNRYKDPAGSPRDSRANIALPRAVVAFDYKFTDDIILGAELEFEYGGTGAGMELEYSEAGEYEMEIEKAGEVMLEQFHVTKRFRNWFNVRVGHMIVPVGLTNAHHEPILFFGTSRPEGEMAVLPCTWHETGISILGYLPSFKYEVMLVNGLDPNGFSTANWVGSGKQGIFELTTMTSPAVAARVEYTGVKNLRLSASGYYGNSARNSSKPQAMTGLKGRVAIASADAQYIGHNVIARANFIYGDLTDSKAISDVNRTIFTKTGYPLTAVAKNAMTYSAELGYDVFGPFRMKQKLIPFVRYEYYNTAETVEEGARQQPRYKRDIFSFGLNYQILPNMVIKADYAIRRIDYGNYNDEHTFGIGLAYTGWFFKK